MKRTNASLFGLALVSSLLGLLFGCLGWCLYQPQQAANIGRAFIFHVKWVLAGPLAVQSAPTIPQILAYAWSATSGIAAVVFMAFWVTSALIFYWISEWASRPR